MSETSFEDLKSPAFPGGVLAPGFLRRQKEDDNGAGSRASSIMGRKRKSKKWDDGLGPGGPITQSAIFPQRQNASEQPSEVDEKDVSPSRDNTDSTLAPEQRDREKVESDSPGESPAESSGRATPRRVTVYDEGDNMVFENEDGEVIDVQPAPRASDEQLPTPVVAGGSKADAGNFWSLGGFRKKVSEVYNGEVEKRKEKGKGERKHEPARAYQFGNTIIVEDEDGEVVKTYELPTGKGEAGEGSNDLINSSLKYMGLSSLARPAAKSPEATTEQGEASGEPKPPVRSWTGRRRASVAVAAEEQAADDLHIRFTIGGVGQRMTKEDFIREVQKLDSRTRKEVVDQSNAPPAVKRIATQDPPVQSLKAKHPVKDDDPPRGRQRPPSAARSSESISPSRIPAGKLRNQPSLEQPETAVERKRRLAALGDQADEADTSETPAERKRRQAALGIDGDGSGDDSDDEGDERVPPARRGITFADSTRPGRKGKETR